MVTLKHIFWGLIILQIENVFGSKILLLPMDHGAHVNMFSVAGTALTNAGHQVWLLATDNDQYKGMIKKAGISPLIIKPSPEASGHDNTAPLFQSALSSGDVEFESILGNMISSFTKLCEEILEDTKLVQEMENINFDLAIVDGVIMYRSIYMIPYHLSIPYITLSAMLDPWSAGVPAMPSIEPMQFSPVRDRMTFWQRLKNIVQYKWFTNTAVDFGAEGKAVVAKHIPNKEPKGFYELHQNSEMWLITLETHCLDYPRVTGNNYQFIGGLSAQKSKPLPAKMAKFVDSSKEGIIVMSFGSIRALAAMPEHMMRKFLDSFRRLKQNVLIRYVGKPLSDVPSNVLMSTWLPQNDLLGHPKAHLFITHAGNNGQIEALHHGVPSLCFPVASDQFYNAERVVARGFGKMMDRISFTSDELFEAIDDIISNSSYKENVQKCNYKGLPFTPRFHCILDQSYS